MSKKPHPHPEWFDFDEENVAAEMASALGVDPEELDEVEESPLTSFGEGEALTVKRGRLEYTIVPDEDAARNIAIAVVTQDLEHEPEIFNPSFIESHIDMKKLSRYVYDVEMEDDYAYDIAQEDPERFWEEAERWGVEDLPEEDEDGEMPDDVDDKYVEELKELIAKDRAQDPMSYFEDIYGRDEATKYAIQAVGIDIEEAAEDAVDTDGWAHFLSRYDGNYGETPAGFVYWREN